MISALALAGLASHVLPAAAADPGASATIKRLQAQNDALAKTLADVQAQLQSLQRTVGDMQQKSAALGKQQETQAAQVRQTAEAQQKVEADVAAASQNASQAVQQVAAQSAKSETWDKLLLWGYGEIYYAHPVHQANQTTLDLARGVFGIGYQFDDKTRFNSEYEVEHAVASADDPGEIEVEQLYVERQLGQGLNARAGVFLIPAGLINENHEPTAFYGVQRNFVETLIIPSTWREGGLSLFGTTDSGLDWNVGLTTGVDLSKWDFAPETATYASALQLIAGDVAPLQATHQEGAFANAQHLSGYVGLNYRGVPGLTIGGLFFGGGATPAQPGIGSQSVMLGEAHVRYQPGKWDLSAVYAQGNISNTGAANRLFPGTANPLPARFDGWYAQAAYNLWQGQGGMRLAPFARYERYDMGASYEGLAPGFGASPAGFPVPHDQVATIGTNFYLNPNVVLKLDYQHFRDNSDFTRVDLGLGLSF
ncbi:MAG: porin [Proteobacteria bacterium]|nr:porin [Pseudomonadota bacterium]